MQSFVVTGSTLLKPLVEAAGNDISHWFNAKTNDVRFAVFVICDLDSKVAHNDVIGLLNGSTRKFRLEGYSREGLVDINQ